MIALNSPLKPNLKKLQKYLEQINNNGWYTNFGPMHNELTVRLEEYLGVKNLLLVNNGTSALQVAAKTLGTESILSTPFSFIATVSAFKWQKDEVCFADIDRSSYNLSPESVKTAYKKGCKADTIVATHVYGNPCDVIALNNIRDEKNVKVIYDAAHAFGIKIGNESVLNFGDASTLSFHATKVFHTIEGGAVVFKDKDNFEKAQQIINFGIQSTQGVINVGLNAKLNEYQAAVGLVNLDEMDNILEHRSNLFDVYRNGLKDIVELPLWHPQANANGAYMPIKLENPLQLQKVMNSLNKNDIQSRHYFSPSLDKIFVDNFNYGSPNSHHVSEGILCLPMHAHLSLDDVSKVMMVIKKTLS
ncbi:DegT/DnrJ/EryC1/StrS family aminotransferase [Shewanella sp. 3_MG-2023]|uniref:DegT/DnrJ/EryC1/StrS aminotransferase family protein n=1 Tax=Shewanella sp. 3_MG-2023 TaxID=3062635 RepID=UPI0026E3A15C|nr:DegT/DnrJ/EryC1/StrS family aminotransferase [Shewanella sp. 3_MG-2023]MDO6776602.1 DegT/DnrJ/EryC1/StrS family aminotransferase [Shewanella sp. 3_MG-2023]